MSVFSRRESPPLLGVPHLFISDRTSCDATSVVLFRSGAVFTRGAILQKRHDAHASRYRTMCRLSRNRTVAVLVGVQGPPEFGDGEGGVILRLFRRVRRLWVGLRTHFFLEQGGRVATADGEGRRLHRYAPLNRRALRWSLSSNEEASMPCVPLRRSLPSNQRPPPLGSAVERG